MNLTSVFKKCPICGKATESRVNTEDYVKWQEGMLIQQAFPYLTADEREMLISGTHSDCWEAMFNDED